MPEDQRLDLWNQGRSDIEIAQAVGQSVATVCRWRHRHRLPPNSKKTILSSEQENRILALIRAGHPLREVADQTGVFVETIRKLALRRGVSYVRSTKRTPAKEVQGTLGYGGYVELRVARDGPYGNLIHHGGKDTGYAPLHRMRMQDKLGRPLAPGEIVHHIDGDIYNNSLANLEVVSSVEEHLALHRETGLRRDKESSDRW